MQLNVLYFAHIRERVGLSEEQITCPEGSTVAAVVALLVARHPAIGPLLPVTRVAVDGVFAAPGETVPDGAEVVLVPPVAGGSPLPLVELTEAPLGRDRLAALSEAVSGPARGATVTFVGTVRDHAHGRAVSELHYEAYAPMALEQMRLIVGEVEAAFPGLRAAVHHRVGALAVGEAAVLVAVASPHRAAAFAACQQIIDRLKQDVPIWKREIGPTGAEWVTERP